MKSKKRKPDKQTLVRALTKFVRAHLAHEDTENELAMAEGEEQAAAARLDTAKQSVCNAVERYEEEYGVQVSSRYVVTVDGQRWSVSGGSNEVFVDTVIELGGK